MSHQLFVRLLNTAMVLMLTVAAVSAQQPLWRIDNFGFDDKPLVMSKGGGAVLLCTFDDSKGAVPVIRETTSGDTLVVFPDSPTFDVADFLPGDSVLATVNVTTVGDSSILQVDLVNLATLTRETVFDTTVQTSLIRYSTPVCLATTSGRWVVFGHYTAKLGYDSESMLWRVDLRSKKAIRIDMTNQFEPSLDDDTLMMMRIERRVHNYSSFFVPSITKIRLEDAEVIVEKPFADSTSTVKNMASGFKLHLLPGGFVATFMDKVYHVDSDSCRFYFLMTPSVISIPGSYWYMKVTEDAVPGTKVKASIKFVNIRGELLDSEIVTRSQYVDVQAINDRYAVIDDMFFSLPTLPSISRVGFALGPKEIAMPGTSIDMFNATIPFDSAATYKWEELSGAGAKGVSWAPTFMHLGPYQITLTATFGDKTTQRHTRSVTEKHADPHLIACVLDTIYGETDSILGHNVQLRSNPTAIILNGTRYPQLFWLESDSLRYDSILKKVDALYAWSPDGQPYLYTLHANPERTDSIYAVWVLIRRELDGRMIDTVRNISFGRPHPGATVDSISGSSIFAHKRGQVWFNLNILFHDPHHQIVEHQVRNLSLDLESGISTVRPYGFARHSDMATTSLELRSFDPILYLHDLGIDDLTTLYDWNDKPSYHSLDLIDSTTLFVIYYDNRYHLIHDLRSGLFTTLPLSYLPGTTIQTDAHRSITGTSFHLYSKSIFPGRRTFPAYIADLLADSVLHVFGAFPTMADGGSNYHIQNTIDQRYFTFDQGKGQPIYLLTIPNQVYERINAGPTQVAERQDAKLSTITKLVIEKSHSSANIILPNDGIWELRVFDICGANVHSLSIAANDQTASFDVGHLPAGMYVCHLSQQHAVVSLTLLILP
jgi:hypothetical protein